MVQLVGDDCVIGAEEDFEDSAVGVKTRGEQDGVLGAHERRDGALEVTMLGLGAADEPHAGHPEAPLVQCFTRRCYDVRVVGQAEVVVSAEVQCWPRLRCDMGGLGRGQLPLVFREPGVVDLAQGGREFIFDQVHGFSFKTNP